MPMANECVAGNQVCVAEGRRDIADLISLTIPPAKTNMTGLTKVVKSSGASGRLDSDQ